MQMVELGNTGLRVCRLCLGTGTDGWSGRSQQSDLGLQKLANLLRYGYDRGIDFWDSADQYGTHPHVARGLAGLNRETVTITTKTCARTAADATKDVDRFLRELRTDYLDIVLLHAVADSNWPETHADAMEVLEHKKQAGVIRAHGVSCHGLGALEQVPSTPWTDILLVRINLAGTNTDGPLDKVMPLLERTAEAGTGIYAMKVLDVGRLGDKAQEAIHFVLDIPAIDAITIGMTSQQEVDDNIRMMEAHDSGRLSAVRAPTGERSEP